MQVALTETQKKIIQKNAKDIFYLLERLNILFLIFAFISSIVLYSNGDKVNGANSMFVFIILA